jgi:hypothetical protein
MIFLTSSDERVEGEEEGDDSEVVAIVTRVAADSAMAKRRCENVC